MTEGRALIVGAGITGATVAHCLAKEGWECRVLEREAAAGGLVRSEIMEGVLYEPHGTHVFHTEDVEVWELATQIVDFRPYRHRVGIMIEGKMLNWPILVDDVASQSDGEQILHELDDRRNVDPEKRAQASNFEDWCLELMGPILYQRYVKPYTEKQWGRQASELSAEFAPRRVQVRWNNDPYLFTDSFQGWPNSPYGYTTLVGGLLDSKRIELVTNARVTFRTLTNWLDASFDAIVLTCPLDEFCGFRHGALEWRGILTKSVHVPHVEHAQPFTVVNYPSHDYPWIRVHETKHASGQQCEGTVLGFEFTGAKARHYPMPDEWNKTLNDSYQRWLLHQLGRRAWFAGRLASYVYADMDDCMRQAIDLVGEICRSRAAGRQPQLR